MKRERQRSLVLVNTGNGKGKSTAAFGVVMRAVARGWRVCVIQFIKSGKWKVGEEAIGRQLNVDWLTCGGGRYDLVVLDEVTYPLNWGWIDESEAIDAIRRRPAHVNVVATGRDAP